MTRFFSKNFILTTQGVAFFFKEKMSEEPQDQQFSLSKFEGLITLASNNYHAILNKKIIDHIVFLSKEHKKIKLFFAISSDEEYEIQSQEYIDLDVPNIIEIATFFNLNFLEKK